MNQKVFHMKTQLLGAALAVFALPALAQDAPSGDAEAGETAFNRQCVACHVVVDADGNKLAGRNAKVGPNLYGVAGKVIGSEEGFRYSDGFGTLNGQGDIWDEAKFVAYVQDPTTWLRDTLGDSSARGKMAFKVRSEADAADIYAYLHSVAQ